MNKLIIDTLKSLNVPTAFLKYTGSSTTYIVFFVLNEQGELFADNDEISTQYNIQIDIYSKSDYTTLVASVKNALKAVGFKRTYAIDIYENDTNLYHKSLRFYYSNEN